MKRMTTQLRALVKAGKFLELPAVHDPLGAKLAESIGFKTKDYITARKQIEDLIGLEEYYKIEEETVEKMHKKENAKKKR